MPLAATWAADLQPVLTETMATYRVPGILVAVSQPGIDTCFTIAGADAADRPLTSHSLFPVASITKLATALAVLRLVDAGRMLLDDPLSLHAPEAAAAQPGVTLRRLLTHTAGLPYDVERNAAPYQRGLNWDVLRSACLATPLDRAPGEWLEYSNVGPGLLAIAVERMAGMPFRQAVGSLVLGPLGIEAYLGEEPPVTPASIAGKYGNYAGTEREPFNSRFWRSIGFPWGGLVTNAEGALRLAQAFAGRPVGFLSQGMPAEATADHAGGVPGTIAGMLNWERTAWGLGPELRGVGKEPCFAPRQASGGSFGHAGASGCLVWHDPVAGVSWFIQGARTFDTWWQAWPAIGAAILSTLR
ncbi:MAG: class A beta-lactamase-related serine hydrolase [Dehalococcoidia bacterium]|nr:class A beta-lactamase-related serine hydrolase [Dehalococcoidia bacterium]